MAMCPGAKKDSEFEDMVDPAVYKEAFQREFAVNTDHPWTNQLSKGKWSRRMPAVFNASGTQWDAATEGKAKAAMVGVDHDRPVPRDHHQPQRLWRQGRETAGVATLTAGDDEAHGTGTSRAADARELDRVLAGLLHRSAKAQVVSPGSRATGSSGNELDIQALIRNARRRLPAGHRALLEQIGVQDAVVDEWPAGVRELYETLGEAAPSVSRLADAIAVWLPGRRVVAYNGPLLVHALGDTELTPSTRQAAIDNIAWHEYGHAISVTRATPDMKREGPELVDLLPLGLRRAIDFPGSYRPREVFDEVIANVYALMIGRAVQLTDYGVPDFLHRDVYDAFRAVVPWPPETR